MAYVTIDQVIEASKDFYAFEDRVKNTQLLKWFIDVPRKIDSKLQRTSHQEFKTLFERIKSALIIANERLEEIESPIVNLFHQDDNSIPKFDQVWIRRMFAHANENCLVDVHKAFQLLHSSIRITRHRVFDCVETFETQVFGGLLRQIRGDIEQVLKINSKAVVGNSQETFDMFERDIVQPLRQLPDTNGHTSIALKTCIKKPYDEYMRFRLKKHNIIQHIADVVATRV